MIDYDTVLNRLWWHPLPLLAVALTAWNDHWLKGTWGAAGGWHAMISGKVSDFSGLFFFPLFVAALASLFVTRYRGGLLTVVCAGTAFVFATMQLVPAIAHRFAEFWSQIVPTRITPDPTDLIALVSVWAAWRWGMRRLETGISCDNTA